MERSSAVEVLTNEKWAFSANKNPIALYSSVQKNTNAARPILIIGGVHGDEPLGVWLSEHVLAWLQETPVSLPWHLITCINPDGYQKNERTNGNGVDLNRNFPCNNWSEAFEKPRYYPGPKPNSEPEVQALVKLIDETRPQLIIHCHSWEPCIVYTGDPAKKDSDRLAKSSGYESRADIGYPTPGSLGEYGWNDKKIPVICIEEQDHQPKEKVWPRFKNGFIEIFADSKPRI